MCCVVNDKPSCVSKNVFVCFPQKTSKAAAQSHSQGKTWFIFVCVVFDVH